MNIKSIHAEVKSVGAKKNYFFTTVGKVAALQIKAGGLLENENGKIDKKVI